MLITSGQAYAYASRPNNDAAAPAASQTSSHSSAAAAAPATQEMKDLTILVWSGSNNDMYEYQVGDLNDMEKVGSNPRMNIVAQIDHTPVGGGVQRLRINHHPEDGLGSDVVGDVPDCEMNDPKQMADFLAWGMEKYPAKRYWVVVSGHGDAWHGASESGPDAKYMGLTEIEAGLAETVRRTGRKLDLISYDCCYMGSAEAAFQVSPYANVMVASQEEVGYWGMPYEKVLATDLSQLSIEEIAQRLVEMGGSDKAEFPTIAAYNLSKMGGVASAAKEFADQLERSKEDATKFAAAREKAQAFYGYRDLVDVARKAAEVDPSLAPSALGLEQSVKATMIAEKHSEDYPGASGLQVETRRHVPTEDYEMTSQEWRQEYQRSAFSKATGWERTWDKLDA
jgi:hypothetical protein